MKRVDVPPSVVGSAVRPLVRAVARHHTEEVLDKATPAVTSNGAGETETKLVARWIDGVVGKRGDDTAAKLVAEVPEAPRCFSAPGIFLS